MRRHQVKFACQGCDIVYMEMDRRERLQIARLRTLTDTMKRLQFSFNFASTRHLSECQVVTLPIKNLYVKLMPAETVAVSIVPSSKSPP